jgi:hypothetical protein
MSETNEKESLIFHFPMDEIFTEISKDAGSSKSGEVLRVYDRLDKSKYAEVEAVRIASDDVFEGCVIFGDPKSKFKYQRSDESAGSEHPYTLTFWAKISDSGKSDQSLLSLEFGKDDQSAAVNRVSFPHPNYKQNLEQQHSWFHCAYVFSGKGERSKIYTNGYQHVSNDEKAFETLAFNQLVIKRVASDSEVQSASVRIADLCLYNGALSKEEILKDKQATVSGSASETFQSTHPIEFTIEDQESTNVLYISDDPKPKNVRIKIRSVAGETIEIVPLKQKSTSLEEKCHFEVIFKPKTLKSLTDSDKSVQYLHEFKLPSEDWHFSQIVHPEKGEISARFTYVKSDDSILNLSPGEELNFEMYYRSAEPSLGTRSSSLMLLYDNIRFANTQGVIRDSRISTINIVNQSGRKNLPIVATIVGSSTISNVKGQKSKIRIRLTNTLKKEPEKKEADVKNKLFFSSGGISKDDDTKFTLRFDKASFAKTFNFTLKTEHETKYENALEEIKKGILASGSIIFVEVEDLIRRSFSAAPDKSEIEDVLKIINEGLGQGKFSSKSSVGEKFASIREKVIKLVVSKATERAVGQVTERTKGSTPDQAFKEDLESSINQLIRGSDSPTFQQAAGKAISAAIERAIDGKISRVVDERLKNEFKVPKTAENRLREKLTYQIRYKFNNPDNTVSLDQLIRSTIDDEIKAHESKKEVIDAAIDRAFENKPDEKAYQSVYDILIDEIYQAPENYSIKRTLGEYISNQTLDRLFDAKRDAQLIKLVKPLIRDAIERAPDDLQLEKTIEKIVEQAVDQAINERMDEVVNLISEPSIINRIKSLAKGEVYKTTDKRSFEQKVDETLEKEIKDYRLKADHAVGLISKSFNQTPQGSRLSFIIDAMMVKLYESPEDYKRGEPFIIESLVEKVIGEFFETNEKYGKALREISMDDFKKSVSQRLPYVSNSFGLDEKVINLTKAEIDSEINLKIASFTYKEISKKADGKPELSEYKKQILTNLLRQSAKSMFDQPDDTRRLKQVVNDVVEAEFRNQSVN